MKNADDLVTAVYRQDFARIERLATPSTINGRDEDGRTPLMHAVLAEDANPEVVRLLVRLGADVNAADKVQKWTSLHFAARDLKQSVVQALIELGANAHATDVFGNTPLWRAIMNRGATPGLIRILVEAGSDPQAKNAHGVSPLDTARNVGRSDLIAELQK